MVDAAVKENIESEVGVVRQKVRPSGTDLAKLSMNGLTSSLQHVAFWNYDKQEYNPAQLRYRMQFRQDGKYIDVPGPTTVDEFRKFARHIDSIADILEQADVELDGRTFEVDDVERAVDYLRGL